MELLARLRGLRMPVFRRRREAVEVVRECSFGLRSVGSGDLWDRSMRISVGPGPERAVCLQEDPSDAPAVDMDTIFGGMADGPDTTGGRASLARRREADRQMGAFLEAFRDMSPELREVYRQSLRRLLETDLRDASRGEWRGESLWLESRDVSAAPLLDEDALQGWLASRRDRSPDC